MSTEARLRELCAINNNIVAESNKMMQYLRIIKEKSEHAITFLNTLNTASILRRYSATYEYLNKFHVKLLDQNCLFELFFLELDEPTSNDLLSVYSSVKDLSAESSNFDTRKQNILEESQYMFSNTSSAINLTQHHNDVRTFNERFDIIESKVNSALPIQEISDESDRNMNINAKEFIPQSTTSSREIIVGSSSFSSRSDISEPANMTINNIASISHAYTAKIPTTDLENKETVDQHNLQSKSNSNISINSRRHKEKVKKPSKHETKLTEVSSESSTNSEPPSVQIKQEEKKVIPKKLEDDDKDVLDIKKALKQVNDKLRAKECPVLIPDLRPVVVQKDTESSSSVQSQPTPPKVVSPKNASPVNKKTNHISCRRESTNIHQHIVPKKGPAPNEGDICCVSSIDSPSSFYIHVIRDDNTIIDSLSHQISEISHRLKSFANKYEARKQIRQYCVCYITNHSSWCRVEVVKWMMEDDNMLEVRLIDYGLICKVHLRNIREANQFLFMLPVMADRCELAWVKPLNGRQDWSNESIEHFHNIINKTDRLFTISYAVEDGDRLIIDLQNNDINSIAGLMINDGQAVNDDESDDSKKWSNEFMRKQIVKSQGFNEEELNQAEEDRLEALMFNDDDDDEEVTDPNLAVTHYVARDESEICRFFLAKGHCFKGKNCTFSHAPLNPDGWTTDREAVYYDAFNQLQLPQIGSEITVKIVHIIDLRSFYVVVKNLPSCIHLIGMPVTNIRSLVKLMNDPEEIRFYKSLTVIPALGEIILVNYENKWHRGRVLGFEEYSYKIELEVLLVDFGLISKFNMKQCRKIKKKHLHVPFQVVLCTLANVTMKENITENDIDIGSNYLELHIENKKLKAIVMYSAHYLNVHLFTETGQDVGEELLKAGLVERCTTSFTSSENHALLVD